MENSYLKTFNEEHLRMCQLKLLEMLKVIVDICERHSITYWLEGGTLLGAVRHKGFIPWDDDLDIAMTREDLERFTQIARTELPDHLVLQNRTTDPTCGFVHTKIIDRNSFYVQGNDDFESDRVAGLFVDIFPYVSYPHVPRGMRKAFFRGICISHSVLSSKHYYSIESAVKLVYFGLKRLFLKSLFNILPKRRRYLTCLPENNWYGVAQLRDSILPVHPVEFEGCMFNAPNDSHDYLSQFYGDYMRIPPADRRKIHSVFIMPQLTQKPNQA